MKTILAICILIIGANSLNVNAQSKVGNYKTYHQNGKLKSEENYRNGNKIGVCKYYYDNGQVQSEESYNTDGYADGTFTSYLRNGRIESTSTYKNGSKYGSSKIYGEDGKLIQESQYELQHQSTDESYTPMQEIEKETYEQNEVDESAKFKGGEGAMLRFIGANLQYPTIAVDNNLQGTVIVRFVVSNTGDIKNVEVVKGFHRLCEKEAVRVVKMMPRWIPAKYKGQNVSVYYNLPIKFILTN